MDIINLPVAPIKQLHKWLPSQHLMITAPTGSGKTVMIINMINRHKFPYYKYYEQIHIFSPTIEIDNNWSMLKNDKKHKFMFKEDLDIEYIYDLLDKQEQLIIIKGKTKAKHHLLIIDDFGGDMKMKQNKFLISLLMKLRHSNIHLWLTSQSYRAIPRPMRLQFMYHIIFRVSPQELDVISTEINANLDENIFRSMFFTAIGERPYNFLYVDIKKQQFYSGFLKKLKHRDIEKLNIDEKIDIEKIENKKTDE